MNDDDDDLIEIKSEESTCLFSNFYTKTNEN